MLAQKSISKLVYSPSKSMMKEFYKSLAAFPDEKFVSEDRVSESILQNVRDPICLSVPNIFCRDSPAECKRCSQVFCAKCVELIAKSDAKCPNCREYLQVRKMNKYLKYILSNLKLRCRLYENGCPVALPLEELIEHESRCEFESVQCPKECGEVLLKKNLPAHSDKECPLEPVDCPLKGCNTKPARSQLEEHKNECMHRDDALKLQEGAQTVTGLDASDLIPETTLSFEVRLFNADISTNFTTKGSDSSETPDDRSTVDSKRSERISVHRYRIETCPYQKYGCTFCGNQAGLAAHEPRCKYGDSKNQLRKRFYSEQIQPTEIQDFSAENVSIKASN